MTNLSMSNNKFDILFELKWLIVGITVCSLLGAIIAGVKVTYFEQTESGRYAVYKECVAWNEACISSCDEDRGTQYEKACNCCQQYEYKTNTLGKRLKELISLYAIYGAGVGVAVGLIIGIEKKKKQNG